MTYANRTDLLKPSDCISWACLHSPHFAHAAQEKYKQTSLSLLPQQHQSPCDLFFGICSGKLQPQIH